jgi:hypothetical protein
MKNPRLWVLEPGQYKFRIEFRFVDESGELLRLKTWDLHRNNTDPPKTLLLQAKARLAGGRPQMKELKPNFWAITTMVCGMEDEPCSACFTGLLGTRQYHQLLAAAPLTLTLLMDNSGLHLALHTAEPKP